MQRSDFENTASKKDESENDSIQNNNNNNKIEGESLQEKLENFSTLPQEININIFSFLSLTEQQNVLGTSRFLNWSMKGRGSPLDLHCLKVIKEIYKLDDIFEINKYLKEFRKSSYYKELVKKGFSEMTDIEVVCFVLTRSSKETCLIEYKKLSKVIIRLEGRNFPKKLLDSLEVTSLAIFYSEARAAKVNNVPYEYSIALSEMAANLQRKIKNITKNKKNCHFVNLSGCDLTDFNKVLNADPSRNTAYGKIKACFWFYLTDLTDVKGLSRDALSDSFEFNCTLTSNSLEICDLVTDQEWYPSLYLIEKEVFNDEKLFDATLSNFWNHIKNNEQGKRFNQIKTIACSIINGLEKSDLIKENKLKIVKIALEHAMFNSTNTYLNTFKEYSNVSLQNINKLFNSNYSYSIDSGRSFLATYKEKLLRKEEILTADGKIHSSIFGRNGN